MWKNSLEKSGVEIKTIDGHEIKTKYQTFTLSNIIKATVGSTGYKGGDTGHGGRTYFAIEDISSTDIRVLVKNPTPGKLYSNHGQCDGFECILGGDHELSTIINALKFITNELEKIAISSKKFM